jgi:hypothetical protein
MSESFCGKLHLRRFSKVDTPDPAETSSATSRNNSLNFEWAYNLKTVVIHHSISDTFVIAFLSLGWKVLSARAARIKVRTKESCRNSLRKIQRHWWLMEPMVSNHHSALSVGPWMLRTVQESRSRLTCFLVRNRPYSNASSWRFFMFQSLRHTSGSRFRISAASVLSLPRYSRGYALNNFFGLGWWCLSRRNLRQRLTPVRALATAENRQTLLKTHCVE